MKHCNITPTGHPPPEVLRSADGGELSPRFIQSCHSCDQAAPQLAQAHCTCKKRSKYRWLHEGCNTLCLNQLDVLRNIFFPNVKMHILLYKITLNGNYSIKSLTINYLFYRNSSYASSVLAGIFCRLGSCFMACKVIHPKMKNY